MNFTEFTEMMAEIGDYIYEKYICLNLSQYKNFDLGARNTTVATVVLCFVIGGMVSAILYYISKRRSAPLVNALLQSGCTDEASAKSIAELDIRTNRSLRRQLRKITPLSKLVYYVGQRFPAPPATDPDAAPAADEPSDSENVDAPEASVDSAASVSYKELLASRREVDFDSTPLYIPKPLTYRAEVRFAGVPRLRTLILVLILFPMLGFAVLRFFPDLMFAADALISFFS